MEVPLCVTCGHHHECGVRCTICGHVGRSQIFLKMKTKAEDKMKKRMTAFANFGMLTPSPVVFKNQPCLCGVDIQRFNEEIVDLLQTLRCAAYGFDVASYNDVESVGSGYVVCRVGDACAGALRIHFLCNQENTVDRVTIDNVHVLPRYRRQRIVYLLLHTALNIINAATQNGLIFHNSSLRINLNKLSVVTSNLSSPDTDWIRGKLEEKGFSRVQSARDDLEYHINIDHPTINNMIAFVHSQL